MAPAAARATSASAAAATGSLSFRACVVPVVVLGAVLVMIAAGQLLPRDAAPTGVIRGLAPPPPPPPLLAQASIPPSAAPPAAPPAPAGDNTKALVPVRCASQTPAPSAATAAAPMTVAVPVQPPRDWFVPVAPDYRTPLFAQLYVDRANKLVHCNINKNACTNWKRILYRLAHPFAKEVPNPRDIHNIDKSGLTQLTSLSPGEAESIINDPDYSFFVTIRDPIERFASAYLDKCYRAGAWEEQQWCGVPVKQGDTSTVDAVINHIAREARFDIDPHFRPQYLMCGLRLLRHKFKVFHFDTLAEEAREWAATNPKFSPSLRRRFADAVDEMIVHAERQYVPPHLTAKKEDILTPARVHRLTQIYYGDLMFFRDELRDTELPYTPIDPWSVIPGLK